MRLAHYFEEPDAGRKALHEAKEASAQTPSIEPTHENRSGRGNTTIHHPPSTIYQIAALLLIAAVALTGCRQKMADTPRYEVYESSTFFDDSLSARPLREGTVARSTPRTDYDAGTNPYYDEGGALLGPGTSAADYENRLVTTFPLEVTRTVLERGQQQYNVYCSPCHGRTGSGQGMIVQRGLRAPVSYHTERLRNAPVGHFYNVITNGYGAMYSYKARVSKADRWAIVAYVRALQLSQHATPEDVPADRRDEMNLSIPQPATP